MPNSKIKNAYFYHPTFKSDSCVFVDILNNISSYGSGGLVVNTSDERVILSVHRNSDSIIISVQYLKNDELPKVANENDGRDEQDLEVPQGKSLSYRNLFVYNERHNLLITSNLHSCPQIGRLRDCLRIVGQESGFISKKSELSFVRIMDRGLIDKLKRARTITMAQFTSRDYYSGDSIDERNLRKYQQFLAGKNFEKTTKLRGKKGENIKSSIQFVLDDIIGNNDMPDSFEIRMTIDGDEVDFQRYFKKYQIEVLMDKNNQKYVDYADLQKRLIDTMERYIAEHEK